MLDEDIFDLSKTDDEISEHVDAELISSPEQFEEMSLTVEKQNKEYLSNLRKKVMLSLDKRKLMEAKRNIDSMEAIGAIFSDPKVMARVRESVGTAQDLKFLSDAYAKILESQKYLMRMDSVDGSGTAKRVSIGVRYEDDSGTKVETMIKTGD